MEGATEAHRDQISGSKNTGHYIIFTGCCEESKFSIIRGIMMLNNTDVSGRTRGADPVSPLL